MAKEQLSPADEAISSCQAISFTHILARHDQVARQIAKAVMEKFGVKWKPAWWYRTPPKVTPITEGGKTGELHWNPVVLTQNQRIEKNHPDLLINLPNGEVIFVECTVCQDSKVVETARDKELKYMPLAADYKSRYPNKAFPRVLPIAIGVRGVVPKRTIESLKYLQDRGFDIPISRLQKAAVKGSVKLIQATLQSA